MTTSAGRTISARELAAIRRSRRRPRWSQYDYLHVRTLVRDIGSALRQVPGPPRDVLDVYCGTRPYDDLLPPGARCVGLDVEGNPYGDLADVVSNEFLPFADESFDLVTCYEAFQHVEDPARGVAELARVLRPGGTALVSVPLVWEYDPSALEHRFTGPQLGALFTGWDDVTVVENGGRIVAWATLTGTLLQRVRGRVRRAVGAGAAAALFAPVFVTLNIVAAVLDRLEERHSHGPLTLPMNLLLTARKPRDD